VNLDEAGTLPAARSKIRLVSILLMTPILLPSSANLLSKVVMEIAKVSCKTRMAVETATIIFNESPHQ
jgi:hypothetical protein